MKYRFLALLIPLSVVIAFICLLNLAGFLYLYPNEIGLFLGMIVSGCIFMIFMFLVIPKVFKKTIDEYWKEHPDEKKPEE